MKNQEGTQNHCQGDDSTTQTLNDGGPIVKKNQLNSFLKFTISFV